MCGILACFGCTDRNIVIKHAMRQQHRGPDQFTCMEIDKDIYFCFHRLSIMDTSDIAMQPFQIDGITAMCNGEIYNYEELREKYEIHVQTGSDCEILPELYKKRVTSFLDELEGMFGIIMYDHTNKKILIARDHIGMIPLYYGYGTNNELWISSELKCIADVCDVKVFPPRKFFYNSIESVIHFNLESWYSFPAITNINTDWTSKIRHELTSAVRNMMKSHVPFACLLSGGLDSSLVSAIARKELPKCFPLHTFCCGTKTSADLIAAREVAEYIGSIHHEIIITPQQVLDVLPEVIRGIETFDITTVRSSCINYLVSQAVRKYGFKMLLVGEGSDEIFGGYLYNHFAPSSGEFTEECYEKISQLHLYDCLRANKVNMMHGIECRFPFLSKSFVNLVMSIPGEKRMPSYIKHGGRGIEKGILRKAFDSANILPSKVLWRTKAQFSDSGHEIIDTLKDIKSNTREIKALSQEHSVYMQIFRENYISSESFETVPIQDSVACSTGNASKWIAAENDPSGRNVLEMFKE